MTQFTPLSALVGGLLIGLAASLLLWLNGRVAGVSGVLGRLLLLRPGDRSWRLLFLAGLIIGTALYTIGSGAPTALRTSLGVPPLLIAGLLTGYGTSLANGCTSGHGVCGIARFSLRSLAATATFVAAALVTTFVIRHVWGLPT